MEILCRIDTYDSDSCFFSGVIWIGVAAGLLLLLKQLNFTAKNEISMLWLWIISAFINVVMQDHVKDGTRTHCLTRLQKVQTLNSFVGPTKVFVSGDTLQVADYSKLDWEWSMFDPESKKRRRETVFPEECKKIYEMGKEMAR